jgi:hypothetical protein
MAIERPTLDAPQAGVRAALERARRPWAVR